MKGQAWPATATAQASVLASDWVVFTVAGFAVALIVYALIFFALIRWRRRPGDAPLQFSNNAPLEIAWTAIPLLVVGGLFLYTYRAEARVDAVAPRPDVVVAVTAYRWGWSFAYRGGPTVGGAANAPPLLGVPATPPELVLPLGETTRIELTGRDVNHGFWVPDFLFKRDAIAGQTSVFDVLPNKLGTYVGRCSSFCGLDHARMLFDVRVVTPQEYGRWKTSRP